MEPLQQHTPDCLACAEGAGQPFPFSMAFQPIVDVEAVRVFAYEALVRGVHGESAWSILSQLNDENRYAFDQSCRVTAIKLAKRLQLDATDAKLAINFMPGAFYSPSTCLQLTVKTALDVGLPLDRLIFEITEAEEIKDRQQLARIVEEYRRHGFTLALDDFGSGYSGLNIFAEVTPDLLKLDMDLTRRLHHRPTALAIVRSTVELCRTLGVALVAEGVETMEEYSALRDCGITLMQGYLLGKPALEQLPKATLPDGMEAAVRAPRVRRMPSRVGVAPICAA